MTMRPRRAGLSSAFLMIAGLTGLASFPFLGGAGCGDSFIGNDAGNGAADDQDASAQDDGGPLHVVPPPDGIDGGKQDAHADAAIDDDASDATSVTDSTPGGPVVDAAVDASSCNDTVDEAAGLFVSPGGAATACGSRTTPCGNVQTAIALATSTAGKSIVYVDKGTYVESVTLAPGITLQGGWNNLGGTWKRQCSGDPATIAVLQAPSTSNVTVNALDFPSGSAPAKLDTLTIHSKATASPAESIYGVIARGASTKIDLVDVEVSVAKGGDGVPGTPGVVGAPGANGCTSASDGAAGGPGGNGAAATPAAFTSNGVTTSTAGDGSPGNPGHNGTAGGAGSCVLGSADCEDNSPNGCSSTTTPASSCGATGTVGCAGNGGTSGHGGGSAGSSIALYAWGATVSVSGGFLASADGGHGGDGGAAGTGGAGGSGVVGAVGANVPKSCTVITKAGHPDPILLCKITSFSGSGGLAGGAGGQGGAGGVGGGGAGGVSFAFVQAGGALVSVASTTVLEHGNGGTGGLAPQAGPVGANGNHN